MKQVGRYQVIGELGRGGMAVVYRARDPELGREVALKVLGLEADAELSQRFEREARAAASTRHPHVLPVYEHGVAQGRLFLAMALAEGGDLGSRLDRDGPLEVREAVELVVKLASAVQAIHDQGVLHRDLKPENVLFSAEGRPMLADLGLAKFVDARTQLTQTGAVLGTPSYMAPEQARGEAATRATDVYGLGALLYCLLTGRPPHEGGGVFQILDAIVSSQPPSVRSLRQDDQVDASLERVVLRCLQPEPEARFATAEELGAALRAWGAGEAPGARRGRALGLALVGVVSLVVALALGLGGRGAGEPVEGEGASPTQSSAYQFAFAWKEAAPEGWVLEDLAASVRVEPALGAGHALVWVARAPKVRKQDRSETASLAPFRAPAGAGAWAGVVVARAAAEGRRACELTLPVNTAARVQASSVHVAVVDAEGRCLSLGPAQTLRPPPAWWAELSPSQRPPAIPEGLEPLADERGCYRNEKDESVLQWIPRGPTRWFSGEQEAATTGGGVFLGREPVTVAQARRFLLEVKKDARDERHANVLLPPAPGGKTKFVELPWLSAQAYCRWAGGRLPGLGDTARAHWGDVPNREAVEQGSETGPFGTAARQLREFCRDTPERHLKGSRRFWAAGVAGKFGGPLARAVGHKAALPFRLCVDAGGRTRAPIPTWKVELAAFAPDVASASRRGPTDAECVPLEGPPISTQSFLRPWPGELTRWADFRKGAPPRSGVEGATAGLVMKAHAEVSLTAGRWVVAAIADDGLRLRWSGSRQPLVDDWVFHREVFYLVPFTVPATGVYRFDLDYCDFFEEAALRVVIFPE